MCMNHTDVAIFTDSLHIGTKILPQFNWMNPEEKAMSVVNKVIVPTLTIVHVQDDFREIVHDNRIVCLFAYMNSLPNECGGAG